MTEPGEPTLVFDVTSTIADVLAANAAPVQGAPKGKSVARRTILFVLVFVATAFVAGTFAGSGDPTAFLRTAMSLEFALAALSNVAVIVAIVAAMSFGVRTINRAFLRRVQVDQRRDHPAVASNDPELRMSRSFRFDETGMTTATAYDEVWESWARITALDETPDLLVLRVGGVLNIPLPKRELPPELRARLRHYVDSRSNSKWPF